MKKFLYFCLGVILAVQCVAVSVTAALPTGSGIVTNCNKVSGREFSSNSTIAKKLDKMFAGDIGLYVNKQKTTLVNAALGTRNVPDNGVYQYWGNGHAGTSCFAYANAFYGKFYDGFSPHDALNGNHQRVKATGRITYQNFVKWGVRNDAVVYIREGSHSVIVLHYDENYITIIDGNGDEKGLVAIRKQPWRRTSGANIFNEKPSLIVQPKTSYFAAGKMGPKPQIPCTAGGPYHSWNDGVVAKEASCKETGEKLFTCDDCGETKSQTISKTSNHVYTDWTVTQSPTCLQAGEKERFCSVCAKQETKKIAKLDHKYGKKKIIKEATVYQDGLSEQTCSVCGTVKKQVIPCGMTDTRSGIAIQVKEKAFSKDTQVRIQALGKEQIEIYRSIQLALQDVSGKYYAVMVMAVRKDETVQPKGGATVTVPIPEGFSDNLAVYQMQEDETAILLKSRLSDNGASVTAYAEKLGLLVLCDLEVLPVDKQGQEATENDVIAAVKVAKGPSQLLQMIVFIVALTGVGILVAVVLWLQLKKEKTKVSAESIEEKTSVE